MKKKTLFLFILIAVLGINGYTQEIKKHNFGFGIGIGVFNDFSYSKTNAGLVVPTSIYEGNVIRDFSCNASFIYEYRLNKKISLSTQPSYIFKYLAFAPMNPFNDPIIGGVGGNYLIHQLDIPLYVNYRIPLTESSNILLGLGASALTNISNSDVIAYVNDDWNYVLKTSTVSPNLLIKAGFEINAKHRTQVVFQYRYGLTKSSYYCIDKVDYGSEFRVNSFDIGLNLFL